MLTLDNASIRRMRKSCDACGRYCSRLHATTAYGMDCDACDDCAGYEPEAYGEELDPILNPTQEPTP